MVPGWFRDLPSRIPDLTAAVEVVRALQMTDQLATPEDTAMNSTQPSVADWVQIIRGEFQESPGLSLTKEQMQRMWGLDTVLCTAVLDALVDSHFLKRMPNGEYARVGVGG